VNSHVESWSPERTLESSERDCRGQNSSPRRVPYINGKLLKCRCLKWLALLIWTSKTQVMAKRRPGSSSNSRESASFDSRPLEVRNRPKILGCRQRATYRWKALDESYNFASKALRSELCTRSYAPSKSRDSQLAGFRDSRAGVLGVPGEKSHLDAGLVEKHRIYYKGEGGGFPQVWAVMSLVCLCCP
jgi:hypothetical protein